MAVGEALHVLTLASHEQVLSGLAPAVLNWLGFVRRQRYLEGGMRLCVGGEKEWMHSPMLETVFS